MIHKKTQSFIAVILIPILMLSSLIAVGQATSAQSASLLPNVPKTNAAIQQDYGQLPLSFVPNAGQTDQAVHFQVNSLGGTLFFTPREVVLSLPQSRKVTNTDTDFMARAIEADTMLDRLDASSNEPPLVVKMQLIGANAEAEIAGADPLPGIVNYFIGNDPSKWHTNIPTYAGVVYRDLYPGIDLRYDGHEGRLKGTYTVAAGVDPSVIRWRYEGNAGLSVDQETGDLLIALTNGSVLREVAPTAWQEVAGRQEAVETRYQLRNGTVQFSVANYDASLPLIIDPTFVYLGYVGGANVDYFMDAAVDQNGNLYAVGITTSNDYPVAVGPDSSWAGSYDIVVSKIRSDGTGYIFSSYLGGTGWDTGEGIALDVQNNIYIVGQTNSDQGSFPILNGPDLTYNGNEDAFITKIRADGTELIFSGYIGGSNSSEYPRSVAVDVQGNAYVVGSLQPLSLPPDFPLLVGPNLAYSGGDQDVFITKISSDGSGLIYSGFVGGSNSDGATDVSVDTANNAYIVGSTNSTNFPLQAGLGVNHKGMRDAFVVKVNSSGSGLIYSSLIGGTDDDVAMSVAVDDNSAVYIAGNTWGTATEFPTKLGPMLTPGGSGDGFVAKLTPNGDAFDFIGYVGGDGLDDVEALAIDGQHNLYIGGRTTSDSSGIPFPVSEGPDLTLSNPYDGFVVKVQAAGDSFGFGTYIGGDAPYESVHGLAVDTSGNVYAVGETLSSPETLPVVGGPSLVNHGKADGFVAKIAQSDSSSTPTATESLTPTLNATPTSTITPSITPSMTPSHTTSPTPSATSTVVAVHLDTIGIFRPSTSTFYLRNSNTTGFADSEITFGAASYFPITGDWNGDGIDTPGVYKSSTGQFFLTNSTANPAVLSYSFVLGSPGDQPIVGDWDGDGRDGVGVFRPSNGLIYLKNSLTTGFADFTMVLGIPGDVGIAGDWNGDGKDSPGVYRPSNQVFYLSNAICNCSVFADAELGLGMAGDTPFVGDWDGDSKSGVGVYRQSNGLTYIKNALTTGFADESFVFGSASDYPLAGYWVRVNPPAVEAAPTFVP